MAREHPLIEQQKAMEAAKGSYIRKISGNRALRNSVWITAAALVGWAGLSYKYGKAITSLDDLEFALSSLTENTRRTDESRNRALQQSDVLIAYGINSNLQLTGIPILDKNGDVADVKYFDGDPIKVFGVPQDSLVKGRFRGRLGDYADDLEGMITSVSRGESPTPIEAEIRGNPVYITVTKSHEGIYTVIFKTGEEYNRLKGQIARTERELGTAASRLQEEQGKFQRKQEELHEVTSGIDQKTQALYSEMTGLGLPQDVFPVIVVDENSLRITFTPYVYGNNPSDLINLQNAAANAKKAKPVIEQYLSASDLDSKPARDVRQYWGRKGTTISIQNLTSQEAYQTEGYGCKVEVTVGGKSVVSSGLHTKMYSPKEEIPGIESLKR